MLCKEISRLALSFGIASFFAFSVIASDTFTEEEFQEFLALIAMGNENDLKDGVALLGKRQLIGGFHEPHRKKAAAKEYSHDIFDWMLFELPQLGFYDDENQENSGDIFNVQKQALPTPKGLSGEQILNGDTSLLEVSPNLKNVGVAPKKTNIYGHRLQGMSATEGSVAKEHIIDLAELLKSNNETLTKQNIAKYFLIVEQALRQAIKDSPEIVSLNLYVGETGNPQQRRNKHVYDFKHGQDRKAVRSREFIKHHGPLVMNGFVHHVEERWSKAFEALVAKIVKIYKRDTTSGKIGNAEAWNLVNAYWESPLRIAILSQEGFIKNRAPKPFKLLKEQKTSPKEPSLVSVKAERQNILGPLPLFPSFQ